MSPSISPSKKNKIKLTIKKFPTFPLLHGELYALYTQNCLAILPTGKEEKKSVHSIP